MCHRAQWDLFFLDIHTARGDHRPHRPPDRGAHHFNKHPLSICGLVELPPLAMAELTTSMVRSNVDLSKGYVHLGPQFLDREPPVRLGVLSPVGDDPSDLYPVVLRSEQDGPKQLEVGSRSLAVQERKPLSGPPHRLRRSARCALCTFVPPFWLRRGAATLSEQRHCPKLVAAGQSGPQARWINGDQATASHARVERCHKTIEQVLVDPHRELLQCREMRHSSQSQTMPQHRHQ